MSNKDLSSLLMHFASLKQCEYHIEEIFDRYNLGLEKREEIFDKIQCLAIVKNEFVKEDDEPALRQKEIYLSQADKEFIAVIDNYPEFITPQDLVDIGLFPTRDSVYRMVSKPWSIPKCPGTSRFVVFRKVDVIEWLENEDQQKYFHGYLSALRGSLK